jgi:hypothetical protein
MLTTISLLSCKAQGCNTIPTHFNSYNDAIAFVKKADFKIKDDVNTSKSSWIRSAAYYSCDGVTGYFIYSTDEREYIHAEVPIELWNEFKEATSFGSFYDRNIKGKYRFTL